VFHDPKAVVSAGFPPKSENPTGTQNQDTSDPVLRAARDPDSPLERALARFAAAIAAKDGIEAAAGTVGAS
jgi:hypothetical protein